MDSNTLMYGTSDAGRNVHNEDPQLAEWLRQAGKKLNLRTHKVKGKVRCGVVWCGAVFVNTCVGQCPFVGFRIHHLAPSVIPYHLSPSVIPYHLSSSVILYHLSPCVFAKTIILAVRPRP